MIQNLQILSHGKDLAQQQVEAIQSPALAELLRHRLAHFTAGHDQDADDAATYRALLANIGRNHLQPMIDRTDGHPAPVELRGAATNALKLAARLLAFADKAHRQAARLEAAASQQEKEA